MVPISFKRKLLFIAIVASFFFLATGAIFWLLAKHNAPSFQGNYTKDMFLSDSICGYAAKPSILITSIKTHKERTIYEAQYHINPNGLRSTGSSDEKQKHLLFSAAPLLLAKACPIQALSLFCTINKMPFLQPTISACQDMGHSICCPFLVRRIWRVL